jgi:hypothetical protein
MKCPKCKSESVSRSHRSGRRERLISRLWIFPFRCNSCRARFYRFEFEQPDRRRRDRELAFYVVAFGLILAFLFYITRFS